MSTEHLNQNVERPLDNFDNQYRYRHKVINMHRLHRAVVSSNAHRIYNKNLACYLRDSKLFGKGICDMVDLNS